MNNKIILIESQPSLTINYYPGSITLEGKDFYFEVRQDNDKIMILWAENTDICSQKATVLEQQIIEIFTKGR